MTYDVAKIPGFGDRNAYVGAGCKSSERLYIELYEYSSRNANGSSYSGFESAIRHHKG
jgi:hypothetical protein